MNKVRYETRRQRMTRCGVLLLLLFQSPALSAEAGGDGARLQPVLREEPGSGGEGLAIVYLDSLTDGLHWVALDAGVVLCHADGATDPAFDETCVTGAGAQNDTYQLRWNADFSVSQIQESRQVVIVALSMDVYNAKKRKRRPHLLPAAKNVIQQVEVFTPADASASRREDLIGAAIYDTISQHDEIFRWFSDLGDIDALLLPRPAGRFEPPAASRYAKVEPAPAPPEIEPEQLARWQAEKERIADLLITDQALEARDRAAALLEQEGLPEDVAQRVEELHGMAVERAGAADSGETPPSETETAPEPLDVMFEVRFAPGGSGFRSGVDGKLYISRRDIRFVPSAAERGDGWSVKWPTLAGFGAAPGVWDVSHPLFIETDGGDKYFVTEKLKNGRYGDGKQILEVLDRGRKIVKGGG